jgi:hypothetical protein
MRAAPTLSDVKNHKNDKDIAMCCILIAPIFTNVGSEDVVPRIGYLDYRSAKYIHFYCAGYGGYWQKSHFPDMQEIGIGKYDEGTEIPWAFSQRVFGEFIDELESETTWRYSGEAELLVMGPDVDFSKCLTFDIAAMLKDKAINHCSELLEALIQYAKVSRESPSAYQFSDKKGGEQLIKATIDGILSFLPKSAQNLLRGGKHYAVKDISCKPKCALTTQHKGLNNEKSGKKYSARFFRKIRKFFNLSQTDDSEL